jgi:UDP-glucose 4-epimerase
MQLDGRHVLVTGGAGFIGSNVVDALLEKGARVRVADDFSVGQERNLTAARALGAEIVAADITDTAAMAAALDGIEVVLHLACSCLRVSLHDPWASDRVNARGSLTVLDAAARAGVERFLYCSSSEVYGTAVRAPMDESHPTRPTTVYGASKLAGEAYALAYFETDALPVSIVRGFNTYGYREHVSGPSAEVIPKMTLRALAGQAPVILGDGEQTRDFTFVSDTVAGLLAAAEWELSMWRTAARCRSHASRSSCAPPVARVLSQCTPLRARQTFAVTARTSNERGSSSTIAPKCPSRRESSATSPTFASTTATSSTTCWPLIASATGNPSRRE